MKFILMMSFQADQERMKHSIVNWPKEDVQAHIQFMKDLNRELRASGEFVSAEGLAWPDQAKIVRAGKNGQPVTDGVFAETKEFLIGYWIIDVPNAERAYKIAAKASAAPGPPCTCATSARCRSCSGSRRTCATACCCPRRTSRARPSVRPPANPSIMSCTSTAGSRVSPAGGSFGGPAATGVTRPP